MSESFFLDVDENNVCQKNRCIRAKLATEFPGAELVAGFLETLSARCHETRDTYGRTLYQLTSWIALNNSVSGEFCPEALTRGALTCYLEHLEKEGISLNSRRRVRVVTRRFARWLCEEKDFMVHDPLQGIALPPPPASTPRVLTPEQRSVLRCLVERDATLRSGALFALGYWAGCSVREVANLRSADTHIDSKSGWILLEDRRGRRRELDLVNAARRPLYAYLGSNERRESDFVFVSQRASHLTENGVHRWFATLKKRAHPEEQALVQEITFHDLRSDFIHRACTAGWSAEELASYLGSTKHGSKPVCRERLRERLGHLRG